MTQPPPATPERPAEQRNALIAEYFDRQLWQFISIDEWLRAHKA